MDIQDPAFEQFVATMGFTVIAIVAGIVVLMFLVMAGALKLSISLIAQHRISFLGALGYLFAITVINLLIGSVLGAFVGPLGGLIALPLTIFSTLACLSQAGNCGYLRAFGVYVVFCFTATIGMLGVGLVAMVPLAMIGNLGNGLEDQFLQAQENGVEFQEGEIQQVSLETFGFDQETSGMEQSDNPIDRPSTIPAASGEALPGPRPTNQPTPPQRSRRASPRNPPKAPVRAPDGTQLNPFFK